MENNNYTPDELEGFFRKQLSGDQDAPDADTWDNIASQQKSRNVWLRTKYYATTLAPVLLVLAIAGGLWWTTSQVEKTKQAQAQNEPPGQLVLQAMPSDSTPNPLNVLPAVARVPHANSSHFTGYNGWPSWNKHNTVPAQSIRFQAEKGVAYTNPSSGNTVRIPGKTLLHADGSPVYGEVELLFREYRTLADYIASGMPMHYSDERDDFHFNSGGMFEVRVAQQGEALHMKPDHHYEVDFTPVNNLSNASLYALNDQTDEWQFVPGQSFAGAEMSENNNGALPPISTEADVLRDNARGKRDTCLPELAAFSLDERPVDWVKDAVRLGYEIANKKTEIPAWYLKNAHRPDEFFMLGFERGDLRVVHRQDGDVRYFFPEDHNQLFTELTAVKDCYFSKTFDTTSAKVPRQDMRVDQIFLNKTNWTRISIEQDYGPFCRFVVADADEQIVLYARIFPSKKSQPGEAFDPNTIFRKYKRLHDERIGKLTAELAAYRHFTRMSQMFQPETEWCMGLSAWYTYFNENLPVMEQRYGSLVKAGADKQDSVAQSLLDRWRERLKTIKLANIDQYRLKAMLKGKNALETTLVLNGFGVYNCDQIFRARGALEVHVKFKSEKGAPIAASTIRLLERDSRMYFTLSFKDRIYKLPGRQVELLVTDTQGKLYHVPSAVYAAYPFASKDGATFTLEEVKETPQSPDDWARLLAI